MSDKLSKKDAAALAGVHYKTVEDWIKTDKYFRENSGYEKDPITGRVAFDETKFRTWLSDKRTGAIKPEQPEPEPETIDAEPIVEETAIATRSTQELATEPPAAIEQAPPAQRSEIEELAIAKQKIGFYTPREAALLTGLPESRLKNELSEKIFGRVVIRQKRLEEFIEKVSADW